jgi:hypothetical protein
MMFCGYYESVQKENQGNAYGARHRWFLAGNWLVYYRVVNNTVYLRGLGLPGSLSS